MSDKDVRPTAMMRYMEEDEQAVSTISKTARRIKIEMNHTWNLRLLPVQMGPDKMPYVRLAQHWWNKAPITCPTWTPKGFGGNPDCVCPVCELSERLNESGSKEVRDIGYSARCVLRFRFWCVVFDTEDARNNIDELPMGEILNPYEFDMYKTTWEDFKKYQKWATTRRKDPSEWGVLDLETGCNLLATHGAKGVRLDRQDPAPIFDLKDANFDAYIKKIWDRLRKPQIIIPTEKQLLELAVKIEEYAENGGKSRSRRGRDDDDDRGARGRGRDDDGDRNGRGRSRYSGEDNDGDSEDRGRSRRTGPPEEAVDHEDSDQTPPTRSRRAAAPEPEADGSETDLAPRRASASAPPPARRASPVAEENNGADTQEEQAAPPSRKSATASAPPPARRAAPEPEGSAVTDEDMEKDQAPDPTPPPPARKTNAAAPSAAPSAPPPARRAAPAATDEGADDSAPQRPPARRSAAAAAPAPEPSMEEDGDTVADEATDAAPPAKERVEDTPPPVAASAPPARRTNASDLQSRLAKLTEKGK